jgi:ABC-2 type transport system permease protein
MTKIGTLARKDIRSLFMSPLFYIIAGLCTLLWSILYILALRDFAERSQFAMIQSRGEGGPNLHYEIFAKHISLVNFIMIMAAAALTMRLFSEEKRQRTFDLLLTSPITATQITLGKFFGGLTAVWALVALSFLYPLSLALFAKLEWGLLLSSYLGLLLVTACYVAVGLLASALTESSVLAVIFALLGNIMLWFMGSFLADGEGKFWQGVHEQLDLGNHFKNFVIGALHIDGLVFFLTLISLFIFVTQRVVESNRWR